VSLVEKAISKLRQAVGEERSNAEEPSGDTANVRTLLAVDAPALRALGYLPEEERNREFADQYRQIKRPLIQKALGIGKGAAGAIVSDPRVIMVTSALPGDGKTFTSVNLALSIARERDVSVLLIDADAPKPHISELFGVSRERGFLDALIDETEAVEGLVLPTSIQGLSLLPAGTRLENATELLASNRLRTVLRDLCAHQPRRLVLLDSPPLLVAAEGRALVPNAGQVVLVVRAGQTPPQAVQDAVALFGEQQAGGIVLNDMTSGPGNRYYGYGQYGGYGNHGDDTSAPG